MKNLLLIAVTILAVGCGEKNEPVAVTKPVEEKQQEIKEEVKADGFIDKWSEFGETVEGTPETWEFFKNGTVKIIDEGEEFGTFKYENIEKNRIIIDTKFGKITVMMSKSGDEITGEIEGAKFKYRRVQRVKPKESAHKTTLVEEKQEEVKEQVKSKEPLTLKNITKLNLQLQIMESIYNNLYGLFGADGEFPKEGPKQMIIKEIQAGGITNSQNGATYKDYNQFTSISDRDTKESRHVIYNASCRFGAKELCLASPWVIQGRRAVVYGEGSREYIEEEEYQKLSTKDGVEMTPFK